MHTVQRWRKENRRARKREEAAGKEQGGRQENEQSTTQAQPHQAEEPQITISLRSWERITRGHPKEVDEESMISPESQDARQKRGMGTELDALHRELEERDEGSQQKWRIRWWSLNCNEKNAPCAFIFLPCHYFICRLCHKESKHCPQKAKPS